MNKMRELSMMAMLASAMMSVPEKETQRIRDLDLSPKQPPVPKGCKTYFFRANGSFSTDRMRHDELVFKCIAASDKSAIRKFNTWQQAQSK